MKLALARLELANFRSFIAPAVIDFEALGPGLIYVDGDNRVDALQSNGAGKSTLWAAIEWCLYGTTGDGLGRTDVLPWGGEGQPRVAAVFSCDNGNGPERIEIVRQGTQATMDGRPAGPDSITNFLVPGAVLMNSLILGQARPLFLDLAPRDKLAIFTAALDLDRWDRRSAAAGRRAAAMIEEAAWSKGEARALTDALEHNRSLRAAAEDNAGKWQEREQKRIDEAKKDLDELDDRRHRIAAILGRAQLALDEAGTALKLLRPDYDLLNRHLGERRGFFRAGEARIAEIRDRLARFAEITEEPVCPSCGQLMSTAHIKEHKRVLNTEITALHTKMKKLGIERLETRLRRLDERMNQLETTIQNARLEVSLQERQLGETDAAKAAKREAAKAAVNPYTAQIDALDASIATATLAYDRAEARAALAERRRARAELWVGGFKEIKLDLVDEVLAEMEMAGNAMLPAIGLDEWKVSYASERETKAGTTVRGITAAVRSPRNAEPVKWAAWSGGERQRLRLVGALALGETLLAHAGIDAGFEVLDEPCDHLSPGGVDAVIEFLADRAARTGRQIFFADQNSLESGRFAAVIRVTKDAGGSRLVVEG